MIELAPRHKIGLPVESPILLAGGSAGYGEAIHPGIDTARLGGIVVGPITRRSIRGSDAPRMAETSGGFVLQTGLQNRGVSAVIKNFARLWPRLGSPVIAQIADNSPEEAASTARRLAQVDGLLGLELRISPQTPAGEMRSLLRAVRRAAELPLWVKLPLTAVEESAQTAAGAGADGLVIASPPAGAGFNRQGELIRGDLHGPGNFAPMLAGLSAVAGLGLGIPLIACGGIHTPQRLRQALAAGASAVQLDSLLWVEPDLLQKLLEMGD
ncbi:MAG: hypothetical protein KJZ86_24425 [Caldilineaceae bacterium]|nr:hypothetical protein [Caldilineaceae bacterium]